MKKQSEDDEIINEEGGVQIGDDAPIKNQTETGDKLDDPVVDADGADESVLNEENAAETIKKLREKLRKSEAERHEYLTGWQRAKADLINARKRDEADRVEFTKFANERLIDGLIPVLESFELAMGNKEAWEKTDKNWRVGVEYIYSQLKKALNEAGLEDIDPTGKLFDHNRDEAAEYIPVEKEADHHKVISVVQKGYMLNGRVMRPPKVRVGEWKKL